MLEATEIGDRTNISKDERRVIKELQDEDSIMVLGADEGRATVVLDKSTYEEKMQSVLSDERTYEKLDKDPTPVHKKKPISILQTLEKENKIRKEDLTSAVLDPLPRSNACVILPCCKHRCNLIIFAPSKDKKG